VVNENKEKVVLHGSAKILDSIVQSAIDCGSSDIHIERRDGRIIIRSRVDGILKEVVQPENILYDGLIARIKVLSRLRTDIHTLPQDGRYTYKNGSQAVDIRLSIMPTYWGEKAVLRLLIKPSGRRKLIDLGFDLADCAVIEKAINQPDGLILVTGPTGSGKTTTLYEILQIISERNISAVSLEDPIEYALGNVTQIPVHHRHSFTFSSALRALLRQDPDAIMVGEIRDTETAELAANAALTGHLVLSTLHTLDASRTIIRLITMGVPNYVLAPSLSLIISQRLIRKVCVDCAVLQPIADWHRQTFISKIKNSAADTADGMSVLLNEEMRGNGCLKCSNTGYKGRFVIYEMISVDDKLRELIRTGSGHESIKSHFKDLGCRNLLGCGIDAVKNGLTTTEEIFRVIQI